MKDIHRYQHTALHSQDEIRLIRVLPGRDNEDLRCVIYHDFLSKHPVYQALSYAWKDNYLFSPGIDVLERISLDDSSVMFVQENLAAFLRHLRRPDEASALIWVDTLCINQDDITERGEQVLQMRKIYGQASLVRIWLGPEKDDTHLALALVDRALELHNRHTSARGLFWGHMERKSFEMGLQRNRDEVLWQAFASLFRRSWWSRTWVVQEALLARQILLHVGRAIINWKILFLLLENLWANPQVSTRTLPPGR